MEPLLFMLPLIILTGVTSSWYDVKKKIIPNALVFPLLAIGIMAYLIFFVYSWQKINSDFLITTITNFSASAILALWWWKIKWWYGGDAKLFVLYSLLIPVSTYRFAYVEYFPALLLLMNSLLPFAVFYTLSQPLKFEMPTIKPLAFAAITVFSLSWIFSFFMLPPVITFMLILLSYKLLEMMPFAYLFQIITSVIRIMVDDSIFNKTFLIDFFFWTILFFGIRRIIYNHIDSINGKVPFAPCLFIGAIITIILSRIFF